MEVAHRVVPVVRERIMKLGVFVRYIPTVRAAGYILLQLDLLPVKSSSVVNSFEAAAPDGH